MRGSHLVTVPALFIIPSLTPSRRTSSGLVGDARQQLHDQPLQRPGGGGDGLGPVLQAGHRLQGGGDQEAAAPRERPEGGRGDCQERHEQPGHGPAGEEEQHWECRPPWQRGQGPGHCQDRPGGILLPVHLQQTPRWGATQADWAPCDSSGVQWLGTRPDCHRQVSESPQESQAKCWRHQVSFLVSLARTSHFITDTKLCGKSWRMSRTPSSACWRRFVMLTAMIGKI